jgi:holo-[acyl-carrier protein] synthase
MRSRSELQAERNQGTIDFNANIAWELKNEARYRRFNESPVENPSSTVAEHAVQHGKHRGLAFRQHCRDFNRRFHEVLECDRDTYQNRLLSPALQRARQYFGDPQWYFSKSLSGSRGTVFTMLLGTGVDLIEVERVAQSIERYGERFLNRIYTPREIAYCNSKRLSAESFAARFAAKEAGAKALGTGIGFGVTWKELEVGRALSGRPSLELSGRARQIAQQMGVRSISISLTHTARIAMAMVIMEN